MATRQWFVGRGDKPDGPYTDERLRQLIGDGHVTGDTLLWCEGMAAWSRAADVPGLMPAAAPPPMRPAPPPLARGAPPPARGMPAARAAAPAAVAAKAPADYSAYSLSTTVGVWPLIGRLILLVLAQIVIIPIPWVATNFMAWFVEHLELPGGQRVAFAGKPLDIWYIFILNALCGYIGFIHQGLQILVIPLTALFSWLIFRWFINNIVWDGSTQPLTFTGGYLPMLGWTVLLPISAITIVGWAWVAVAWMRWNCRHIEGAARHLYFVAGGWSYLWRTWVLVFACAFIIPIPWVVHWYTRWMVSQFALA
jgi:hypothetical protein